LYSRTHILEYNIIENTRAYKIFVFETERVTTCYVITCKFQHTMYGVTTVKTKRRYAPSAHVERYGRLPYSNVAPINPVTFQEQLLQVTIGNTHGGLTNQTSDKLELTRRSNALP